MTTSTGDAVRPYTGDALTALLPPDLRLLGLGEPTHGVEAFPELRNELFRHLVEHEGYRSIAIESDCLAALAADAYVTDGIGTLDEVMAHGFSHGAGAYPANRELLRWMRTHNEQRPPHERLRFYGFDGPLEISGATSPHAALTGLYDYLAAHLDLPWSRATLDELLGSDGHWTHPAVMLDPNRSVGRTPEARELRLVADDLRVLLTAHAPQLTAATSADDWWRADLYSRTVTGLLRYHAGLADTTPDRISALLGQRGVMMADNLDAIVRREARRGPTLVFAHNSHLQRYESSMPFGGLRVRWWSAGAMIATRLGDRYAFVATTFGARGADVPGPDTLEGVLSTVPHARAVVDPQMFAAALDRTLTPRVPADYTYSGLDPATLDRIDAIVFVKEI
ncbi:erythromycin esterase family protein [Micromonospora echinofusca]|uniref:Erythromycin esterase n=1 Tax=Micromonospora echinofusca TaxID=47858 RepID=A0ABS3VR64_MICEH|nr:erythromycin esterase family protein [Micromonospora echinofusca]MBO4206992.1 erythromycin esterase [Micromonospora echinofusca]